MTGLRFASLVLLGALAVWSQEFSDYERRVTEFTLANGLHFIVLERHQAPVVSFHTYVNAGSIEDPAGQTGLAHLMEHMAFKGTEAVGTRNWSEEQKALERVDAAWAEYDQERNRGARADAGRLASLELKLRTAEEAARNLTDPGEYQRVFQENGAVGIASRTTADASETSYSLPSNRIELWFLLESQRLAHPVFRDDSPERDSMAQEARTTVDSDPHAKLLQALVATAFEAHPYRNPGLGWPGDVANLRRTDMRSFFDTYYVPANMAIGIAGDVDPANVQRLAERYFGSLPEKPLPRMLISSEPPQLGPKLVVLGVNAQPMLMVGFKRPPEANRDDVVFDVIRALLAEGRLGLLYRNLVEEKRLAQSVEVTSIYPSWRYPGLFVLTVIPAADHSVAENQKALDSVLARFSSTLVDDQSVDRAKHALRVRAMRTLSSNERMAALLPDYYFNFGDWRRLFTEVGEIDKVTPEAVLRVASQYFTPAGRTTAEILNSAGQIAEVGGAQ